MIRTCKNLSLNEFRVMAAALGQMCLNHDVVIGLNGSLGSGKTEFVKWFAKAYKIGGIRSPSFTVINAYQKRGRRFYHIDFYRLTKPSHLKPLGIFEILKSQNRTALIEWAARFPQIQRQADIIINLRIKPNHHRDVFIRSKKPFTLKPC